MPLQLKPPVEETFELKETDKLYASEGTTVTIVQASQRQHEKRQNLFANMRSRWTDDDSVEIIQRYNQPELHRVETMLTMTACNILAENGKSLFKFKNDKINMTDQDFADAWGILELSITSEIHSKVLEVNPTWANRGEGP
jgi:hypothetical protein